MTLRILSGILRPDLISPNKDNNTTINFKEHTDSKHIITKAVTIGRKGYGFQETLFNFSGYNKHILCVEFLDI